MLLKVSVKILLTLFRAIFLFYSFLFFLLRNLKFLLKFIMVNVDDVDSHLENCSLLLLLFTLLQLLQLLFFINDWLLFIFKVLYFLNTRNAIILITCFLLFLWIICRIFRIIELTFILNMFITKNLFTLFLTTNLALILFACFYFRFIQ